MTFVVNSQEIATHAARLAHGHIAGFPGRHEPESETLDFGAIEPALQEASYDGFLGEAGLGWLRC